VGPLLAPVVFLLPTPSDRGRVAGGDEFIANLWDVHRRVKEEGYVQVGTRFFNLELGWILETDSTTYII
jgi:hypothetical protein